MCRIFFFKGQRITFPVEGLVSVVTELSAKTINSPLEVTAGAHLGLRKKKKNYVSLVLRTYVLDVIAFSFISSLPTPLELATTVWI